MSYKWQGTSESGILRKNDTKDKLEDLLVFGYACKLFRDDEKAIFIDQGKHLIPWMGDEKLKIDRYDGRGTLSELSSCEASREGYDAMRWLGLSEAERRLEQLCDEERYYSLNINEEEEELYKEEELKRIQQKGKEVGYNYEAPAPEYENSQGPSLPSEGEEEEEEPFILPPELDVPVNVTLPKTAKENVRIEKTALFISKQGLQMEILLKAKQKDNPQFSFMTSDDPLYRYYRHVLMSIKTGHYQVKSEQPAEQQQEEEETKQESEDHYLHPSLITAPVLVESAPPLPALPFKPSADCAYSQLVNRIQSQSQPEMLADPQLYQAQQQNCALTPLQQQQQYYQQNQQYYAQYYEYYRQHGYYPQYPSHAGYPVAGKQDPANPYAQIVSNVAQNAPPKPEAPNPYAQIISKVQETVQIQKQPPENYPAAAPAPDISRAPILYGPSVSEVPPSNSPVDFKKPLLSLAEYGSGSEEEEETEKESIAFITPPADTQIIIDKMASYVAKNGTDFEAIVKSKGDPRFVFLNPEHEFYKYYKYKIGVYANFSKKNAEVATGTGKEGEDCKKNKEKKVIAPVSFSIKKAKENETTIEKSALPVEESDEEEEEKEQTCEVPEKPPDNPTSDETTCLEVSSGNSKEEVVTAMTTTTVAIKKENNDHQEPEVKISPTEDPLLELIDLTDDLEERRDAKRAEDRLKDKIAAAAREKLSSSTRDKALQLERKKRAAAFLSQLKKSGNDERESKRAKTDGAEGDTTKADTEIRVKNSDSEEEGEIKGGKHQKSKRKKSHKRKRSKNKHDRKEHKRDHKKPKKHRRRNSTSSCNSDR